MPIDASNWRYVAAVKPLPEQKRFVASVAYYLCLTHYGAERNPLAVVSDGSIVGHMMWAVDDEDGSVWPGGLIIDSHH
jgi:diamine N-acetyltransferase